MDQNMEIEINTNTSPISLSKEELKRIKQCEYARKYREKHPNYAKEYAKKYRELHPGYNNKNSIKWHKNHKDVVAAISKRYNDKKRLIKAVESGKVADILCAYISYNP